MERRLILLVALVFFVTPGTAFLSFANDTQVNITLAGCGVSKLCVQLNGCDPAGNQSCLFMSVVASTSVTSNGTTFSITLTGESSGYITLVLAVNVSEATNMAFICAQNSSANGTFFFLTRQRNNTNGVLSPANNTVTDIRGLVKGNMIQCGFSILSMSTTFSILLGKGNDSTLGTFNVLVNTLPLNLTNPSSNVSTIAAPTAAPTTAPTAAPTAAPTTAPTTAVSSTTTITTTTTLMKTTAASGALHPHAPVASLLILLGILTLSLLQKA